MSFSVRFVSPALGAEHLFAAWPQRWIISHQESLLCSNPFKYYTTAALTLYTYDYLLTFSDEVSLGIKPEVTRVITSVLR